MPIIGNDDIKNIIENITCEGLLATSPMEPISLLDGAEVKAGKCPICRSPYHLEHDCGFLCCPHCRAVYKTFGGKVYRIVNIDNLENITVNELILRNTNMQRLPDYGPAYTSPTAPYPFSNNR